MKSISFLEKKDIDIKTSLSLFGDINKYNEKLGEFLVGIHAKIKQLIVFMQKQDLQNYNICVRSMKNDARYYGFNNLGTVAELHEAHSASGDLHYIQEHINDLITVTNEAIVLIQEYMNGTDEEQVNIETTNAETYDTATILVVDDSNIIRNFVKKIFSDKYNVATAKNGEEAINLIEANKKNDNIKTILLDLNMPKVDGFAVLEYMRQNDYLEKIPVSIISGDSSKATIERAFTYDIIDMLSKPFTDSSIKQVVEKTLYYKDLI